MARALRMPPGPVIRLAELRCAKCGAAEVVAVAPGSEDQRAADLFVLKRAAPVRAWCLQCLATKPERRKGIK